jgi:tungstate transport system substrate-binding protein
MAMRTALSLSRRSAAFVLALALAGLPGLAVGQTPNSNELIVLTTTTTQDSGILKHITEAFQSKTGFNVKTIVAGSGDILKQGARGEGDVLLTHSPAAEKEWMKQGHGLSRRLVMYNDFVIIGMPDDPAGVKGLKAADALKRIAEKKAVFVSRGDQSGTHVRELAMWKRAGIDPKGQSWYRETGQGQGLTMEVAMQQQGYTFTDRGTYLVHAKRLGLPILVEGDPGLFNIYHVMPVDPAKFPKANAAAAKAFADYLVSPEGQERIGEFGKAQYGRPLFVPAADKTEEQLLVN